MNLKQLSELLGLSQTTVSRALNGYPEVSETTRKRVQDAARDHGYRPNPRARGLATGKSGAIGHVITTTRQNEMVNPVFGDFLAGANIAYGRHHYTMSLSIVPDTQEELTYRALAQQGSVDGVVVQAPLVDDPRIAMLKDIGMPFIVHGRSSNVSLPYDWVDVNNRSAFHTATRHLLELGHRNIALINGDEQLDFAWRRRKGWEDALREAGISPDPDRARSGEMNEHNGWRDAGEMLDRPAPPTAFVVSSLISAFGVRRAVQERGLRLGEDVSLITFDDDLSYLRDSADPPVFSVLRSSVSEAGELSADLLIQRIRSPKAPPLTRLLEAELIAGRSTGPVPAHVVRA
ncbi:MAG: LacI family transcriptional regulator [Rhodobacterales bacterium]|nr:MAG: LacI family transcriptional regulator [Rhodobacterales bacterium]